MTTVAERLKGHTSLALASQTVDRQWILTLITPQRKDADGNVTAVLVATRDATEEKRREQKQEDALRLSLIHIWSMPTTSSSCATSSTATSPTSS